MQVPKIYGPFSQIITMDNLSVKGSIGDEQLQIITEGGILTNGDTILDVGSFDALIADNPAADIIETDGDIVALPGFTDPHTHICFAGSRANDYAMRISGKTYLEIAKEGGGIWQTVQKTREASLDFLAERTLERADRLLKSGITTAEVKSGYGLTLDHELKMLSAIQKANDASEIDFISTCLAAHITPRDFQGKSGDYLSYIFSEILPAVKKDKLSDRVDVFIEEGAFNASEATTFLVSARALGFDLTIHGDQFTPAGSKVAVEVGALSVDHLESTGDEEIAALAKSNVIATVLPGASLGLGMQYAPARKLLNEGCAIAIGSDWNPGSAPMGNLLTQASLLGAAEKMSNAETFAGITFRSAKALNLHDRGVLSKGNLADIVGFPCNDYREILYHQGELKPGLVIKKGIKIH